MGNHLASLWEVEGFGYRTVSIIKISEIHETEVKLAVDMILNDSRINYVKIRKRIENIYIHKKIHYWGDTYTHDV